MQRMRRPFSQPQHDSRAAGRLAEAADRALFLQGQVAARALARDRPIRDLSEVEFRVYSQWGEDGIIEWLLSQVDVPNHRFVEFGVETFREANCRFLLRHRNWKGLVIDGSKRNIASLREEPLCWMHDLTAKAAFVTAQNINSLIVEAGFAGPLGLLSIDIDGNDYWVWKAIEAVDPAIVVCEFNAVLGDNRALTIPYDAAFVRLKAHHSGLYFGASIAAFRQLADAKGYVFVGTNSAGNNAFFIKRERAGSALANLTAARAFPSRFRESRDASGALTFVGGPERLDVIRDLPVVNLATGKIQPLRDVGGLYSEAWLSGMC